MLYEVITLPDEIVDAGTPLDDRNEILLDALPFVGIGDQLARWTAHLQGVEGDAVALGIDLGPENVDAA